MIRRQAFGKSSKRENLDRLRSKLPSLTSTTALQVTIPAYEGQDSLHYGWNAENLIWRFKPDLKKQILSILATNASLTEKSQQIQSLLFATKWEEDHFSKHMSMQGDLIIRSSVSCEDQSDHSAAGIFESVRVKKPEEINDAFVKVLAANFSEKALTFFEQLPNKQGASLLDMEWIIQRYVSDGDYSGVAFSVVNGQKWNVAGLQVVKGLGGGVDGAQRPVVALVETQQQLIDDLRIEKQDHLPCDLETSKSIGSYVKQLENTFGIPVAIEFVGKGREISVVQLRPIKHLET